MQTLLLLHGALGSASQFRELGLRLEEKYKVHAVNFSGHDGLPFSQAGFSIPLFASEVLDYITALSCFILIVLFLKLLINLQLSRLSKFRL